MALAWKRTGWWVHGPQVSAPPPGTTLRRAPRNQPAQTDESGGHCFIGGGKRRPASCTLSPAAASALPASLPARTSAGGEGTGREAGRSLSVSRRAGGAEAARPGLGLGTLLAGPARQPAVPVTETTPRKDQALRAGGEACTCLPRGLPLPVPKVGREGGAHTRLTLQPTAPLPSGGGRVPRRPGRALTVRRPVAPAELLPAVQAREALVPEAGQLRAPGSPLPCCRGTSSWHLPPTMGPASRPLTCRPGVRCVVRRVTLERPKCSLVLAASRRRADVLHKAWGGEGGAPSEAHVVLSARIWVQALLPTFRGDAHKW